MSEADAQHHLERREKEEQTPLPGLTIWAVSDGRPPVEIAPGVSVPRLYRVRLDEKTFPECEVLVEVLEGGRAVCRHLRVTARSPNETIDWKTLRRIPIDRLMTETLGLVAEASIDVGGRTLRIAPGSLAPGEGREALLRQVREKLKPAKTGGRPPLSDDHLEEVARVYRSAPQTPAKFVEEYFNRDGYVSRSTISRWIRRARDAGHLGQAIPRKPGEVSSNSKKGEKDG
jgi:hypothetical protein